MSIKSGQVQGFADVVHVRGQFQKARFPSGGLVRYSRVGGHSFLRWMDFLAVEQFYHPEAEDRLLSFNCQVNTSALHLECRIGFPRTAAEQAKSNGGGLGQERVHGLEDGDTMVLANHMVAFG